MIAPVICIDCIYCHISKGWVFFFWIALPKCIPSTKWCMSILCVAEMHCTSDTLIVVFQVTGRLCPSPVTPYFFDRSVTRVKVPSFMLDLHQLLGSQVDPLLCWVWYLTHKLYLELPPYSFIAFFLFLWSHWLSVSVACPMVMQNSWIKRAATIGELYLLRSRWNMGFWSELWWAVALYSVSSERWSTEAQIWDWTPPRPLDCGLQPTKLAPSPVLSSVSSLIGLTTSVVLLPCTLCCHPAHAVRLAQRGAVPQEMRVGWSSDLFLCALH